MTRHNQVHITVDDRDAEVDEGVAPVIEACWRLGIETVVSCQENRPEMMWVNFASALDASAFLEAILPKIDDSLEGLYYRAIGLRDAEDCDVFRRERVWQWSTSVQDINTSDDLDENDAFPPRRPFFWFDVSVRFPEDDYPVVLERLRRAADAGGSRGGALAQVRRRNRLVAKV
jgi:hypothetical protein